MGRYQVKCRRCRQWLLSDESVIDSHGNQVQGGDQCDWGCGGKGGVTQTQLFVSTDHGPPWVMEKIAESGYTQGKLLCPKCQGRLGSFDFVRAVRPCSCGQGLQPPAHLLRDRVDVVDLSQRHAVTTPVLHSRLATPETCITDLLHPATAADAEDSTTENHDDTDSLELEWLFIEPQTTETSQVPSMQCNDSKREASMQNSSVFSLAAVESDEGESRDSLVCDGSEEAPLSRRRLRRRLRRSRCAGDSGQVCGKVCQTTRWSQIGVEAFGEDLENRRGEDKALKGRTSGERSEVTQLPEKERRSASVSLSNRKREKEEREKEEQQQLQLEEVLWEHTCPMCLEVMWRPHTTLPCRHQFCEGCLRRLTTVSTPERCDCPLCRQRIAKCVHDADLGNHINTTYPIHIKVRRREEKRHQQRSRNIPLPGLPFPHSYLVQFPRSSPRLSPAYTRRMAILFISVLIVVVLAYVGMVICLTVMDELSGLFDGVLVKLTGERLWSQFLGVESRVVTVSCVFVLYLICACMVHYLPIFRQIQR